MPDQPSKVNIPDTWQSVIDSLEKAANEWDKISTLKKEDLPASRLLDADELFESLKNQLDNLS